MVQTDCGIAAVDDLMAPNTTKGQYKQGEPLEDRPSPSEC